MRKIKYIAVAGALVALAVPSAAMADFIRRKTCGGTGSHHRRSRAVIYGTTPSRGRMPRAGPSRRAPETPADTAALVWTSSEVQLKQCPRMKRDSTNRWLIAIAPRGRRAGRTFRPLSDPKPEAL